MLTCSIPLNKKNRPTTQATFSKAKAPLWCHNRLMPNHTTQSAGTRPMRLQCRGYAPSYRPFRGYARGKSPLPYPPTQLPGLLLRSMLVTYNCMLFRGVIKAPICRIGVLFHVNT